MEEADIKKGLRYAKNRQLFDDLIELEETLPPVQQSTGFNRKYIYWWIGVLAIIGGLALAKWYFSSSPVTPTPPQEMIFAANFENYPAIGLTRNEIEATDFQKALLSYQQEDFQKSALAFDQLYQKEKDPMALFYAGLSYLNHKNTSLTAIDRLKNFIQLDTPLRTKAQWYLGLAYLRMNQTTVLSKLITEMPDSSDRKRLQELQVQLLNN